MVKVNGENVQWEEGMTIKSLLEKCNYVYPLIVVKVNGKVVEDRNEYCSFAINDNDDIKVIHMMSGG